MKKYFYLAILLFSFITGELNAQKSNQSITDQPTKKALFKDVHVSSGGTIDAGFKGVVVFDDRLLAKGMKSISLFPVDTMRTISYIRPENVTKSLLDIDAECQYGILVLSTSSAEPTILPESVLLSNLEQIILNSKKILYKNENQEPD